MSEKRSSLIWVLLLALVLILAFLFMRQRRVPEVVRAAPGAEDSTASAEMEQTKARMLAGLKSLKDDEAREALELEKAKEQIRAEIKADLASPVPEFDVDWGSYEIVLEDKTNKAITPGEDLGEGAADYFLTDKYRDTVTTLGTQTRIMRVLKIIDKGKAYEHDKVLAALAAKNLRPATLVEMVEFFNEYRTFFFRRKWTNMTAPGSQTLRNEECATKNDDKCGWCGPYFPSLSMNSAKDKISAGGRATCYLWNVGDFILAVMMK
jgi:hypothetical protein